MYTHVYIHTPMSCGYLLYNEQNKVPIESLKVVTRLNLYVNCATWYLSHMSDVVERMNSNSKTIGKLTTHI